MGLEPETFDILQLTGLWWNLRNLPVLFCSFLRNTCAFLPPCFRIFLAHWKKSWMHSPCRKKDIYLCSAQVDMVVIKGIVQSHCHHILDKTKSLSVASWLLLPIIVIHLVIGPAYYLFVIFWTRPDHCSLRASWTLRRLPGPPSLHKAPCNCPSEPVSYVHTYIYKYICEIQIRLENKIHKQKIDFKFHRQ